MFRRKDELDMDGEFDAQASLLGAEPDSVNVLSAEKAAQYKAQREDTEGKTENKSEESLKQDSSEMKSQSTSFSSPSSYGNNAPRPIQTKSAEPSSSSPTAVNSNLYNPSPSSPLSIPKNLTGSATPVSSFRPSSAAPAGDAQRFRPQTEANRATNSNPTSNYNNESSSMLNKHNQSERVLTVGNDIMLKGEITACDRLVIEGNVDATVSEVNIMELSAAGSFKGDAEVEYAEISGNFSGNLTVRNSLVIHKTGKVSGSITYGEIEIARGGTITGEIKTIQSKSENASVKKNEKIAA